MESRSFQSQMLSIMEVLAKAAVAEIDRRVDDSCAVLRLEVSQSRRDIELLKRKCELMEAELRRSRARVRRKVFHPAALPSIRAAPGEDGQAEADRRPALAWQPPAVCDLSPASGQGDPDAAGPVSGADVVRIKEEGGEDDTWKSDLEEKLVFGSEPPHLDASAESFSGVFSSEGPPTDPGCPGYEPFAERRADRGEAELVVKTEAEDKDAGRIQPGFGFEDGAGQAWSPGAGCFLYEQTAPTLVTPGGKHAGDAETPPPPPPGRSHLAVVSAARVKRRARTFGFRRPHPDEGHDPSCSNSAQTSEDPTDQHQGRGAFGLARGMRTPWRSGVGEKRFKCTYCDKSFIRFSQLKEHLRSHTGEKPFSCMQCGRSFTKQCNLIRHAVVHSGEKPHHCSLCGKCFTQRSSLKSHQKTAH